MNNVQAEITITLGQKVEKTEKNKSFNRFYRFSIPVGATFDEAIVFAEEMLKQVKIMKENVKPKKDTSVKDTGVKDTSVKEASLKETSLKEKK